MAHDDDGTTTTIALPEHLIRLSAELPPGARDALRLELWQMRERIRILELAITAAAGGAPRSRSQLERDGESILAAYFALRRVGQRAEAARVRDDVPAPIRNLCLLASTGGVRELTDQSGARAWELMRLGEMLVTVGGMRAADWF